MLGPGVTKKNPLTYGYVGEMSMEILEPKLGLQILTQAHINDRRIEAIDETTICSNIFQQLNLTCLMSTLDH